MGHSAEKSKYEFNRITSRSNTLINLMFIIICIIFVAPLVLVLMVSFSSEQAILQHGYQLIPSSLSASAYEYVF